MTLVDNPFPGAWSKIFIIAGPPGNRNDLICGWLSSQYKKFFYNDWCLHPIWGKSECKSWWNLTQLVNLKDPQIFQNFKNKINHEIQTGYKHDGKYATVKSHLTSHWLKQHLIDENTKKYFQIVDVIPTTPQAIAKVNWENFVKGFLCFSQIKSRLHQVQQRCQMMLGNYYTGELKTDLIKIYDNWETRIDSKFLTSCQDSEFPSIKVDYDQLMQPDGIENLDKSLNLDRNPVVKSTWKQCVEMADVPDRVWAWDRIWVRFDLR